MTGWKSGSMIYSITVAHTHHAVTLTSSSLAGLWGLCPRSLRPHRRSFASRIVRFSPCRVIWVASFSAKDQGRRPSPSKKGGEDNGTCGQKGGPERTRLRKEQTLFKPAHVHLIVHDRDLCGSVKVPELILTLINASKMARLPLLGQQAVRFEPYAPRATIFQTRLVLRALKILMVFVCGCVLLVRVGRDSTRYDNHNNYHLSSFFKSHPRQERINVTEILTAWIPFQRSTIFTLPSADSDQQNSLAALRGTALKIEIDPKEIYNPIARQPFYVGEGSVPGGRGVFNLGLLKLPEGSQWGYLGVARGLETVRDWIKVGDWPGKEQTLIM